VSWVLYVYLCPWLPLPSSCMVVALRPGFLPFLAWALLPASSFCCVVLFGLSTTFWSPHSMCLAVLCRFEVLHVRVGVGFLPFFGIEVYRVLPASRHVIVC
jgi:hypothetical protein